MSGEPSEIEQLQGKQILFVDDNLEILRSVKIELEQYGLKVSTCESAFDIPERLDGSTMAFDMVITDLLGMTKGERKFVPHRQLQPIIESYPTIPFLIYSTDHGRNALQYEDKGARGFVLKEDGIAGLIKAIIHILVQEQPHFYFSKSIQPHKKRSSREREVSGCAGRDRLDALEIARKFSLSRQIVKNYLTNIRKRLEVTTHTKR